MRLVEIQDKVRGVIEDDAFWTDAKLVVMINDAMNDALAAFNITRVKSYEERDTVESQKRYNLPSDHIETYFIYYDSGYNRVIEIVDDPQWMYRRVSDLDTEGAPTHAYFWNIEDREELWLYPVPDDAYTLNWFFWATPAALVNDDDEPQIPIDQHQKLVDYCIMRCKAEDTNTMNAMMAFHAWWEVQLNKMKISNAAKTNARRNEEPGSAEGLFSNTEFPEVLKLFSITYRW